MKKIFLIACCSKKLEGTHPAEKLYQSDLFKKSLAYAKSQNADGIYILSAKYHLVPLDLELENYNVTLNNFSVAEKKKWAEIVLSKLKENVMWLGSTLAVYKPLLSHTSFAFITLPSLFIP